MWKPWSPITVTYAVCWLSHRPTLRCVGGRAQEKRTSTKRWGSLGTIAEAGVLSMEISLVAFETAHLWFYFRGFYRSYN